MFNRVFVRDFLFLLTKSKHELIEVIYDSLDFLALKGYLACRSLAVFRLFLRFHVWISNAALCNNHHCCRVFFGQLLYDLINDSANFEQNVLSRVISRFCSLRTDFLYVGDRLFGTHVGTTFELALLEGPEISYLLYNTTPLEPTHVHTDRWGAVFFLKIHTTWILNFNGYQRNLWIGR